MRRLVAIALLGALAGSAAAQDFVVPGELPPEEDEVGGTCATPRQAWLQLLWWAHSDPVQASLCIDTSRLENPDDAAALAVRLVEHLDARGLRIDTEGAPTDPAYVDPDTHRPFYRDPAAPAYVMVRGRDGRWLLSPNSVARIPQPSFVKRVALWLPDWFRSYLFGVQVWQFLGVVLLVFVAFLVQRLTLFFLRTYFRRLVSRARKSFLDKAVERADRPIGGLAMAGVFHLGFPLLLFPLGASQVAQVATQALAAYSFVWLAYRLIDILAQWLGTKAAGTHTKLDDQLIPLVARTLKVFVSVIGGIFVLQNLDVDVSSLLAGLGLGGLAFALAAKDTVANLFGSVMIFVDKPFQIGDSVIIDKVEGTIEEVGFRTTRIRTPYNSLVSLPNSTIVNSSVDNYGARRYRRYQITLRLTYDTPREAILGFMEALRGLITSMDGLRKDFYVVELHELGESSLDVLFCCFIIAPDYGGELRLRTRLNIDILRIAEELGVKMAYPTRTVQMQIDQAKAPG
ncbi:MAG TPA: mechanosensitive ion channel domain-containing protein [Kofleriaceae bacterium]|nr:mechanosensitive ion channel domain-containing protein [Kofleriaceae bacterium]